MPVDTCSSVVGGTTRLECRVLGDPPPDIRWFKDGRDITHNRRFSFSSSADGDVSILIENISPRDEGHYRCRAENSEGFASTSAYLVVRGYRQHPDDAMEQVHTMQVEDVFSSKGTSGTVSPIRLRKDADEAGRRRTFEQIVDEEKGGGRDGRLKMNGKETSTKSSHTRHEFTFSQSSTAGELSGSRRVVMMEENEERTEVKVTTLDSQPRDGSRQSSALTQSLFTKEKLSSPLRDGSSCEESSDAQTSRTSSISGSMTTTSHVTSARGDVAADGAQTSRDSQIEIVITDDESFWSRTSRTSRSVTSRPEVNRSAPISQQTGVDQSLSRSQQTGVDQSLSRSQQTGVDQSLSRSQQTGVDQPLSRSQQTGVDQPLSRSQQTGVDQPLSRLGQSEVLHKGSVLTEVISEKSVTMATNVSKKFLADESRTEMVGREAADGEIQTREKSIAVPEMTDADTGHTEALDSSSLHREKSGSQQRETTPSSVMTDGLRDTAISNERQLAEINHSDIFKRTSAAETLRNTTSSFETEEIKVKQSSEVAALSGKLSTPATAPMSEPGGVGGEAKSEHSDAGGEAEMKGPEHIPLACRLQPQLEREWAEWGDQETTGEPSSSLLHDSGFADTSLMEVSQTPDFSLTDATVLLPEGIQAVSEVENWEKEKSRDSPGVSKQTHAMEAAKAAGDDHKTDAIPETTKTWRRRKRQNEDEENEDRETRLLDQHRHLDDTEARQDSASSQLHNLPSYPEIGALDGAKETSELERISTRVATLEAEEMKEQEVTGLMPMRPEQRAVEEEEESGWSEGGWVSQVTRNETVTMEGERKVVEARTSGDLSAHTSGVGANTSGSQTQTAEPQEKSGVEEDSEFSVVGSTAETETVVGDLESSVDPVTVDRERIRAGDELSSPAGSRAGDFLQTGDVSMREGKEGQRSETGEMDASHTSFASVGGAGRSREEDSTDTVVAEASSSSRHRQTSVESETETMKSSQEKPQLPRETEDDEAKGGAYATGEVEVSKKAAPRVLSTPEDVKVNQGETIRLVSQVIGNPLPEVKWFKECDTVKPGDRVTLQVADDLFTLEIKEATEEDGGTYTLTAHNSEGTIFSDVLVTVTIPPSIGLSGEELRVVASLTIPDIVARSGEVTVRALGSLQLVCTVRGNPSPSVVWSKDGEALQADSRQRIYDSQGQYYMEIPRVTIEDAGEYTCTASNSEGSVSCSIAVFVESTDIHASAAEEGAAAMEPHNQQESSSDVSGSSVQSTITRHLKLVAAAAAFSLAAFGLKKIVESLPKGS